ncbi:MFS transporter [Pedobacter sp.]|uniref:MFS transporter n=1 Tax=Pedobacter sp. TaxID=1411316 RepID=UPI003D7F3662
MKETTSPPFTKYQKLVIFLLAMTQFTVILDFMIMSPLGDMLMKSLSLTPTKFGVAVSAYAFSAGISGLLTAGFADKYDRKKLLLFYYTGFTIGTVACGFANSYEFLLVARIITGLFGGVIGSISMAIVTDMFALEQRGRVMGFLQMGFGASQVLGIPISIWLANHWGWESPFLATAALAAIVAVVILVKMRPIAEHLALQHDRSVVAHLWSTVANRDYRIGFTATALLSIGGFMMMPFSSAFAVNNLGVYSTRLPILFMVSGVCALIVMPMIGKLSDKVNKFKLFALASIWLMVVCVLYTNQSVIPFGLVILFNIIMMMGIMGRMVPSIALTSAIPSMADRGGFMSINASLQQIAGGVAASVAGTIVYQKTPASPLEHYDIVGYVIVVVSIVGIILMYRVNNMINRRAAEVAVNTGEVIGKS